MHSYHCKRNFFKYYRPFLLLLYNVGHFPKIGDFKENYQIFKNNRIIAPGKKIVQFKCNLYQNL